MEKRSNDAYETLLYDFLKFDILVSCPKCNNQAFVKSFENFSFNKVNEKVSFVCVSCGLNKKFGEIPFLQSNTVGTKAIIIGAPVDPYFQLPLFLKREVKSKILWAYNLEHLKFLKSHIESMLRERNGIEIRNNSLGSRLPKWITSNKNREQILKNIEILSRQLEI